MHQLGAMQLAIVSCTFKLTILLPVQERLDQQMRSEANWALLLGV